MIVTAGATSRSLYFYIQEDAGATNPGEPVTALVFGDLDSASYARQGGARVAITLATLASASAAWATGGFILVDDTNMAGTYRLDVPDAAFATGVDQVVVQIDPGAARVCVPLSVDILDVDLRDTVRAGLTALPNAAADAPGGLPVSDGGGLDLDTQLAATNEVTAARMAALTDWINGGRLDLIIDAILVDTTGLNGDAMRGTDSAALASVATEGRLAELDGGNLPADIAAIQTDTDDIQTRLPAALVGGAMDSDVSVIQASAAQTIRDEILPTQNAAFNNIEFLFVAASDNVTPVTGATGTAVTRSIDGGAFGSGTGTLAEVGNGIYQYDASAADMNGGVITFRFIGTGGTPGAPNDVFLTIVTGGGV